MISISFINQSCYLSCADPSSVWHTAAFSTGLQQQPAILPNWCATLPNLF